MRLFQFWGVELPHQLSPTRAEGARDPVLNPSLILRNFYYLLWLFLCFGRLAKLLLPTLSGREG